MVFVLIKNLLFNYIEFSNEKWSDCAPNSGPFYTYTIFISIEYMCIHKHIFLNHDVYIRVKSQRYKVCAVRGWQKNRFFFI